MTEADHGKLAHLKIEITVDYLQHLRLNPLQLTLIVRKRKQSIIRPQHIPTSNLSQHGLTPRVINFSGIRLVTQV